MLSAVALLFALLFFTTLAALAWLGLQHRKLIQKYKPIIDIEAELSRHRADVQRIAADRVALENSSASRMAILNADYAKAKALYDRLRHEISLLEENLEDISFGLYKPHYGFDASERYRIELERVTTQKKALIRADTAAKMLVAWTVGGSRKEGEKMQRQLMKLMLRAFNGETDAAIAKVTWKNAAQMEERIRKSFDAVNALGTVVQVSITPEYRDLALAELRLEHEWAEKKREEAEEQRRIREQMREEEKAQRELEKAEQQAEEEEGRFERALAKARADVEKANAEQAESIRARIATLEAQLAEAHAKAERAKSLAQMTRSGHVYVISNIGSFGERVVKIGMTRRLDPLDRVKELGDASVPFEFDVHGLVWSEDAPGLENALHRHFDTQRVNRVNQRKEFFEVGLHQIQDFLKGRGLDLELTLLAEAREYRETVAMRQRAGGAPVEAETFPASLGG